MLINQRELKKFLNSNPSNADFLDYILKYPTLYTLAFRILDLTFFIANYSKYKMKPIVVIPRSLVTQREIRDWFLHLNYYEHLNLSLADLKVLLDVLITPKIIRSYLYIDFTARFNILDEKNKPFIKEFLYKFDIERKHKPRKYKLRSYESFISEWHIVIFCVKYLT